MTETDALLVLNAISGLSSGRIRKLIGHFGSALQVLSAHEADLTASSIIPAQVISNIIDFPKDNFLKNEYNLITSKRGSVLTCFDTDYPESLREIPDAPVVLYIQGKITAENHLAIAFVGSRKASLYGMSVASQFSTRLAEMGVTIVSGLARGIDSAAHRGCLKAGGETLAVLGCGLSHIYPPENRDLFEQISRQGAVISEFPMDAPVMPFNFPKRNRIISGLSLGVVVVEAAVKSGALITADFALEQGREVYAVPGKIDNPNSGGVHHLIKQGARLITCFEDILEDLKIPFSLHLKDNTITKHDSSDHAFNEQERIVLKHIQDTPVHIDELVGLCGSSISDTASTLFQLELKKAVKQLPGKMFVR